ncbi:MAG: CinA family protein, partial [Anaerolineae bacterium]
MKIEEQVGALLRERGLTMVTAESCTGGLVGHRLTNVSGSSDYYLGGVVAYSNQLKEALLGVRAETLLAHGAVSEETAREMARGARQRLGADVAVSITGIAGPTGGTEDKPVGLVYVGLSAADAEWCRRFVFEQDRLGNKQASAEAALGLVVEYVTGGEGKTMLDFIKEPVSVEVRIRPDGTELPLAFAWQGQRYEIGSWGRESSETQEGRDVRCYLVQTAGPQTWELCLDLEMGQWMLNRRWPGNPQIA